MRIIVTMERGVAGGEMNNLGFYVIFDKIIVFSDNLIKARNPRNHKTQVFVLIVKELNKT